MNTESMELLMAELEMALWVRNRVESCRRKLQLAASDLEDACLQEIQQAEKLRNLLAVTK